MTDNIRKILADSLSSLVVAYEGEAERVQHEMEGLDERLSDYQGRLSDSVKDAKRVEDDLRADLDAVRAELVATQAKLATMPHRPGAFAESVEAESRLVAEAERRRADHEAIVRRLEGERDDWQKRAAVAEKAVDQARSDRNAVTLERDAVQKQLDAERVSHNGTLVKLRHQLDAQSLSGVAYEVAAERLRQKTECGWIEQRDDKHTDGELAWAATYYAAPDLDRFDVDIWPFDSIPKLYGMGPTGRRKELIVAAALIVAEIERLDRVAKKAPPLLVVSQPPIASGPLSAPIVPGMPCQPPEEVARGLLDLERAEARDATGRAP